MKASRTRIGVLRRRLRKHNREVVLVSAFSLLGSLALWGSAYVLSYWVVLFLLTALVGPEARMPAHFTTGFTVLVVALFAVAWFEKRLNPHPTTVDKKPALEIALDFLLIAPRLMLSIPDHLGAWQSLSPAELTQAIAFVDAVRAARKFPLHSAPVELPDERTRDRIIFALLHVRVLEMFREENTSWLRYIGAPAPALESAGPYLS